MAATTEDISRWFDIYHRRLAAHYLTGVDLGGTRIGKAYIDIKDLYYNSDMI